MQIDKGDGRCKYVQVDGHSLYLIPKWLSKKRLPASLQASDK